MEIIKQVTGIDVSRDTLDCALGTIDTHGQMKAYYERMLDKGKPKKVGITAIARKMPLLVYYLWVNETNYDPN